MPPSFIFLTCTKSIRGGLAWSVELGDGLLFALMLFISLCVFLVMSDTPRSPIDRYWSYIPANSGSNTSIIIIPNSYTNKNQYTRNCVGTTTSIKHV